MRRFLKFLHTVATATLVGALALQLLFVWRYETALVAGDATAIAVRHVALVVTQWLTVPSLVVCVVTGLALMGINRSFASAGWVWIKAGIGLLLIKGVMAVTEPAVRDLSALVAQTASLATDAGALAEVARLARMEWLSGWLALVLSLASIALGVWRPRFNEGRAAARAQAAASAVGSTAAAAPNRDSEAAAANDDALDPARGPAAPSDVQHGPRRR